MELQFTGNAPWMRPVTIILLGKVLNAVCASGNYCNSADNIGQTHHHYPASAWHCVFLHPFHRIWKRRNMEISEIARRKEEKVHPLNCGMWTRHNNEKKIMKRSGDKRERWGSAKNEKSGGDNERAAGICELTPYPFILWRGACSNACSTRRPVHYEAYLDNH